MKNLLLLGSSGFLGTAVATHFEKKGFSVISVKSHLNFNMFDEWINYFESCFSKAMPSIVINAGACQSPSDSFEDIVELTKSNTICPAIIAKTILKIEPSCIFITIGTSWQYNSTKQYRPFNLYAASKKAQDDYLTHFCLDGLRCASLIMFDSYADYDHRQKIHNLIKRSIQQSEILEMTGGEQVMNFVHIEDCAQAIYMSYSNLEKNDYGFLVKWAIKSPQSIQVKQLLALVDREKSYLFLLGKKPYRNREIYEINEEFEVVPGWKPKYDPINDFIKMFKI